MLKAIASLAVTLSSLVPVHCDSSTGSDSCPEFEALLEQQAPAAGWDVGHMSAIMWRESRCQPTAYNRWGKASGLLQITPVNYPVLRDALGAWVDRWTLQDPTQNIQAAAVLYDYWVQAGHSGYVPWAL